MIKKITNEKMFNITKEEKVKILDILKREYEDDTITIDRVNNLLKLDYEDCIDHPNEMISHFVKLFVKEIRYS